MNPPKYFILIIYVSLFLCFSLQALFFSTNQSKWVNLIQKNNNLVISFKLTI